MSAAKVALGRRLFFETRLSVTGRYSCASCHRPELAYTDGRAHAVGATGESVRRGAMSLTNVAYNPAFTWGNAQVRTLEQQMRQPLFNRHPVEMGLRGDGSEAVADLARDSRYLADFRASFPGATRALQHVARDQGDRRVRAHLDLGPLALRSLCIRRRSQRAIRVCKARHDSFLLGPDRLRPMPFWNQFLRAADLSRVTRLSAPFMPIPAYTMWMGAAAIRPAIRA